MWGRLAACAPLSKRRYGVAPEQADFKSAAGYKRLLKNKRAKDTF